MYVTVPYNKVLFSILYFLTSQSEVDFGIALVHTYVTTDDTSNYCKEVLRFELIRTFEQYHVNSEVLITDTFKSIILHKWMWRLLTGRLQTHTRKFV